MQSWVDLSCLPAVRPGHGETEESFLGYSQMRNFTLNTPLHFQELEAEWFE